MPGSPRASATSAPLSLIRRPRPASSPSSNSPALTPPRLYSPLSICLADARQPEKDGTPILQVLRPLHTPLPCFVAAVDRVRTIAAAASFFCSGTSSTATIKGGRMMAATTPKLCLSSHSMPAAATRQITTVQRKLDWKRVCLALVQEKKGDASRCRVNLPPTLLLEGGVPIAWLFTSVRYGVILKKKERSLMDWEAIQRVFVSSSSSSGSSSRSSSAEGRGALAKLEEGDEHAATGGKKGKGVAPVAWLQQEEKESQLLDAHVFLQHCMLCCFPPQFQAVQCILRGLSSSSSSSGGGNGAVFEHEYSLSPLGVVAQRSVRCINLPLFWGAVRGEEQEEGMRKRRRRRRRRKGGGNDQEEEEKSRRYQRSGLPGTGGKSRNSSRSSNGTQICSLRCTNQVWNQKMEDATRQIVRHVEGVYGCRVAKLRCDFVLDTREDDPTLWLRRTRDCLIVPCPTLAPPPPRSHSRYHGEEEEEEMKEEGEKEGHTWQQEQQQEQQRVVDPPPSPVWVPGRHIEGRMLERRRRLEARRQVDKAEVARIMARPECF